MTDGSAAPAAVVAPVAPAIAVVPTAPVADATVLAAAAPVPAADATVLAAAAAPAAPVADAPTAEVVPTSAPEAYEAFVVPEERTVSEDFLTAFEAKVRELDLPQDRAQAVLDFQFELDAAREVTADHEFKTVIADWRKSAVADPEIGGVHWEGTKAAAGRYLTKHGTPALIQLFNETGIGNHPEIIRSYASGGKEIAEDKIEGGASAAAVPTTRAERMFRNHAKPA